MEEQKRVVGRFESRVVMVVEGIGGNGAFYVGGVITGRSNAGKEFAVRLIELIRDYGPGERCEFWYEFADKR